MRAGCGGAAGVSISLAVLCISDAVCKLSVLCEGTRHGRGKEKEAGAKHTQPLAPPRRARLDSTRLDCLRRSLHLSCWRAWRVGLPPARALGVLPASARQAGKHTFNRITDCDSARRETEEGAGDFDKGERVSRRRARERGDGHTGRRGDPLFGSDTKTTVSSFCFGNFFS